MLSEPGPASGRLNVSSPLKERGFHVRFSEFNCRRLVICGVNWTHKTEQTHQDKNCWNEQTLHNSCTSGEFYGVELHYPPDLIKVHFYRTVGWTCGVEKVVCMSLSSLIDTMW